MMRYWTGQYREQSDFRREASVLRLFPLICCGLLAFGTRSFVSAQDAEPKPSLQEQISAKEKELAQKQEAVAAVEKELAALRQTIPGDFPNLKKLLESIPADLRPRADEKYEIERHKANLWAEENLLGKEVEFQIEVRSVRITPIDKKNAYAVETSFKTTTEYIPIGNGAGRVPMISNGVVQIGEETFFVDVSRPKWKSVSEETARQLRDLEGKTVSLKCKLALQNEGSKLFSNRRFQFKPIDVTLDGIDPTK